MKQKLAGWLRTSPILQWLLRTAVSWVGPRQHVGVAAAVFNNAGQVLLVEHVFRPVFPWGLPGGWVNRGEDPVAAIRRELAEELGVQVEVKHLLLCRPQGREIGVPTGLGLAYYCRWDGRGAAEPASHAHEILQVKWLAPAQITQPLNPIDRQAVILGQQAFARETSTH
jgi:ADP-ribose pyrophosphatase YjhB (NUDIX family)